MSRLKTCILVPAPVEAGTGRRGADMGARALRAAGIAETLSDLGLKVIERPPVSIGPVEARRHPNLAIRDIGEIAAWTAAIETAAYQAAAEGVPMFLGGDHSLAAGSIAGVSRRAREEGEELFVLWLDAHSDFTPSTAPRAATCTASLWPMSPAAAASRAGTRRSSRR